MLFTKKHRSRLYRDSTLQEIWGVSMYTVHIKKSAIYCRLLKHMFLKGQSQGHRAKVTYLEVKKIKRCKKLLGQCIII